MLSKESLSQYFKGVLNIQTEPRKDALSRHLGIMDELEVIQSQISNKLHSGDVTADNMLALSEVIGREIEEMGGGLARRRSLTLFGRFTISLPPARTY